MKRITFTLLATSFACVSFATAQDQDNPAPVVRRNAPARGQAEARHSAPAPQVQRSAANRAQQAPTFRAQQSPRISPRYNAEIARQPHFNGQRFNGDAARIRTYQPRVPTAGVSGETNVTAPVATVPTGDRRSGTTGATDWRSRNTGTVTDQTLNTGTGRHGEWRNRTGTQNGSSNYNGSYSGGRNWNHNRTHHHRDWWRSRYNRFALFGGGYYYWNSGYWYPAYGYDPYFSTYAYDAPIYGYNDQDPGQVMSDVQSELARRGYYYGAIDGTYGPRTREALLRFQRENGLEMSGIIDQPTLESLGYQ